MVGDLGLVLGPLFVGYLIAAFTGNWLVSFGATAVVLAAVSFFILGTKIKCNIR
jgi:hypothetical protein